MDNAIYTALGGANAALNRQAIISNNLANTTTDGFRAQMSAYRAVPVEGPGMATRTLAVESTPGFDSQQGKLYSTGRPLDVALSQQGWLSIELPDGTEAYTRDGNIQVDNEGQLRVRGRPLLGESGPLSVPPQSALTIAPDGTITALGSGDKPSEISEIGRIKLINVPGSMLVHGDDGLFHSRDNPLQPLPHNPNVRLIPEMLESSNVSPVKSMVAMISVGREFDMHMKIISTVDNNEKRANQLLSAG